MQPTSKWMSISAERLEDVVASNVFNFLREINSLTLNIKTTSYKYSDIVIEWKYFIRYLIGNTYPFTNQGHLHLILAPAIIKDTLWCLCAEQENLRCHGIKAVCMEYVDLTIREKSFPTNYDVSLEERDPTFVQMAKRHDAGITFNLRYK